MGKEIQNVETTSRVLHQEPASIGCYTKTLCKLETKIFRSVKFVSFLWIEQRALVIVFVVFGEENQPMVLFFGHALSRGGEPRRAYGFGSLEICKAEAFEDRIQEILRKI